MIPYLLNLFRRRPPVTGILCFPDPEHRDLAARFVNSAGLVLDVSSGAWSANPAASLVTLSPVANADLAGWQVAAIPSFPANSGPVVAFVHPAGGGEPVDAPIPLSSPAPLVLYGVAFAS